MLARWRLRFAAKRGLTRRQLLVRSASTAALAGLGTLAKPYLSRAADRPADPCGIQSGDVSANSAVIWARADRAARMQVECATDENFKTILRAASADALPDSDFTSKLLLDGLPAGQDIFYRVRFESINGSGIAGETQVGHFRTAPSAQKSVSFVWSGDTAGQGWGIDPSRGGMRTYRTMLQNRPDFFIHSGDHIYADCPVPSELKLPDGGIWRNIVTRRKIRRRAQSRSVSRQLQIQSARRKFSCLPCRGADARAVGRPRGDQRLVADRLCRRDRL